MEEESSEEEEAEESVAEKSGGESLDDPAADGDSLGERSIASVPGTVLSDTSLPVTSLVLSTQAAQPAATKSRRRTSADGPVGEPVAPVAAAHTSEDTSARRRGVHLVGQCVDTLPIHVDYEDPEEAEEGFHYDVAAARRQRASAASAWPPPPARGRPSREEHMARNPRSRAERWHASGGTVGRPSPAGDGGGARR